MIFMNQCRECGFQFPSQKIPKRCRRCFKQFIITNSLDRICPECNIKFKAFSNDHAYCEKCFKEITIKIKKLILTRIKEAIRNKGSINIRLFNFLVESWFKEYKQRFHILDLGFSLKELQKQLKKHFNIVHYFRCKQCGIFLLKPERHLNFNSDPLTECEYKKNNRKPQNNIQCGLYSSKSKYNYITKIKYFFNHIIEVHLFWESNKPYSPSKIPPESWNLLKGVKPND